MKALSDSPAYNRLLQQVVIDLGVPPRQPRGSRSNRKRARMWPAVYAETNRRWKEREKQKALVVG